MKREPKFWFLVTIMAVCMFMPAVSATAQALAPVTLKIIACGPPQKDVQLVNDALTAYVKPKFNATVVLEQYDWDAWNDKANLIIASGEEADLMFTAPWCGFTTNAPKGAFLDMSDLVQKYGKGILNSSYKWIVDVGRMNGKLYAIPAYQLLAQSRGFFLRKDLLDKYGPSVNFKVKGRYSGGSVKDVFNPEDLEPLLKVIKQNEPEIIPYYGIPSKLLSWLGPWDRQGQFEVTTINVYDKVPKYINFYDTDYYRKSMDIARKWFVEGLTNQDIATTKEDATEQMKAGKTFCYSQEAQYLSEEVGSRQYGYELVNLNVIKPIISTSLVQGAMWAIPRQAKDPARSMMLLNLMHTDRTVANLLVYGVEGKHYVKKGGNVIAFTPANDPANALYYNQVWEFGNQALLFDLDGDPPNGAKRLEDFNTLAIRNSALGFTYDATNMKNEIGVLTNIAAEFDPQISSGTVDARADGTYAKFLAKLKAGGIDKLLADQNAQLNAWLKANKK